MVLEKLILNILFVLAPILIYTAFGDGGKHLRSRIEIGLIMGISSSLCLLFSYQALDLYWDLRYVPLIIATVYGGPIAGLINVLMLFAFRTYLGEHGLLMGLTCITIAYLGAIWFAKRVFSTTGRLRIRAATLISFICSCIMLLVQTFALLIHSPIHIMDFSPFPIILLFEFVQILATWLSATLQELYLERAAMREVIERAEKLKTLGEVASSIAHEVRNPLTAVQGFLQLMKASIIEGTNQKYLQIALDELARAEAVIHEYLNFSKPKLMKYDQISLTHLMENIQLILTPIASPRSIRLVIHVRQNILIFADLKQLQQALVNLIKNAIEASRDQSVVLVELSQLECHAEIRIRDKGKGMTPGEIQRIGTLFYTTKENGTGLGATVALRIIEAMKGNVHFESEVGKGTVCIIKLPLEPVS
ncbi:two-component sensor histidine kinase [Paenibacillus zeisoli]|uniref:histidine kinase n=1 Tax=Paenibacillus zeisoli TaxID=2496267 RepID=A0A433XNI4_9BACL|nr:ATP-binding protein [Paenibacillus zeisoli]RUT35635.1 two-component sensor histidine kinase [Paenibacillus zeisoli]